MKNIVVAGEYKDHQIAFNFGKLYFLQGMKTQEIAKTSVSSWQVVDNLQTDMGGKMVFNWMEWTKDTSTEKIHPTQKPVPLLMKLIEGVVEP